MEPESTKYRAVIELLKRSVPEPEGMEAMTERILRKAVKPAAVPSFTDRLADVLFGWAYVGWVRRSLVAVSFAVMAFFIFQQYVIIKKINSIDRQIVYTDGRFSQQPSGSVNALLMKGSALGSNSAKASLSKKQLEEAIKSLNEIEKKYSDILKIIESDPVLKEYIRKNLDDNSRKKLNL